MTREEIVALLDHVNDSINRHDVEAMGGDYTGDCIVESPMAGAPVHGREAVQTLHRGLFTSFPDLQVRRESLLVDGDAVASLSKLSGTDTGGFMGIPPTNKKFECSLVRLYELRDGLIARERRIYDFTGLLVQIGVLKAKPA